MVVVRAFSVFALTEARTEPFPEPVVPALITIHGTGLLAAQVHPAGATTSTVTCSAVELTLIRARETS
jgi:hypothetical protein